MPFINRVGGGVGPGSEPSLKSLTVQSTNEQKVYTPETGYDGYSKVTVKAEKTCFAYGNCFYTVSNDGKVLVISTALPYTDVYATSKLTSLLHMASITMQSSGTEDTKYYSELLLIFTKVSTTKVTANVLFKGNGNASWSSSIVNSSGIFPGGTFPGTIVYDTSANTLTLTINDDATLCFHPYRDYAITLVYRDNQ